MCHLNVIKFVSRPSTIMEEKKDCICTKKAKWPFSQINKFADTAIFSCTAEYCIGLMRYLCNLTFISTFQLP